MKAVWDFSSRRILVTGAGKGIGRELCVALARSNARLCALSRTSADLESLRDEISSDSDVPENSRCIDIVPCDLSSTISIQSALQSIGEVDFLVNNAGVSFLDSFLETRIEDVDKTMDINVKAPLILGQFVAKSLIERGVTDGAIVNVSSQASQRALPGHTSYCISKAAVDQLTRMMALELGPKGIRVNAVNPTVVLTEMGNRAWSDPKKAGPMLERIPLGRFAECEDVVSVIIFLLSNQAKMVHGSIVPIEGGFWTT